MALPAGSTLITVLLSSDQTYLANCAADNKLWHLFMSIGNMRSHIRNRPTEHSSILIALLPMGSKRTKGIKGFTLKQQELDALIVQHKILERILEPLSKVYQVMI